jgi:hypothetical protein
MKPTVESDNAACSAMGAAYIDSAYKRVADIPAVPQAMEADLIFWAILYLWHPTP